MGLRNGPEREGGLLDRGFQQVSKFGMMVEGFSRFSRLLDANFDAMHGTFHSVFRMLEMFGEFFYVIKGFFVFRFLWRLANFLLGRDVSKKDKLQKGKEATNAINLAEFDEFQTQKKKQRASLITFLVLAVAIPFALIKLWRFLKGKYNLEFLHEDDMDGAWGSKPQMVRAITDFQGETRDDLDFKKDDIIEVIGKLSPEWWEGAINGRRGVFPAHFVEEMQTEEKEKDFEVVN